MRRKPAVEKNMDTLLWIKQIKTYICRPNITLFRTDATQADEKTKEETECIPTAGERPRRGERNGSGRSGRGPAESCRGVTARRRETVAERGGGRSGMRSGGEAGDDEEMTRDCEV